MSFGAQLLLGQATIISTTLEAPLSIVMAHFAGLARRRPECTPDHRLSALYPWPDLSSLEYDDRTGLAWP
jgi:hypothetical protein